MFEPPDFGVTFLGASNGFDKKDSTSGIIVWVNQKGILIDPPAFSTYALQKVGIPHTMIDKIVITHCQAENDCGIFQKLLTSTSTEIITTPTIMSSFIRKYSALIGITPEELRKLFQFRPVTIDYPLMLHGATFRFHYTLHSIPTIGFTLEHGDEMLYFSSDTCYDPAVLSNLHASGIISRGRLQQLGEPEWTRFSYILHDAGGKPLNTPIECLAALPEDVKRKMTIYHIATEDVTKGSGLVKAECGLSQTRVFRKDIDRNSLLRNLEIVSNIDFFERVPLKRVCDLVRCIKEVKYKQSDFIIREGTKGNKFYVVKQGVCKIYSRKPGREFSKSVYPGDHFGESAVTGDGIRLANVVADTDCMLLEINKHDFVWCLGGQFEQGAVGLMKNLSALRQTSYAEFINKYIWLIQEPIHFEVDRAAEDRPQHAHRSRAGRGRRGLVANERQVRVCHLHMLRSL